MSDPKSTYGDPVEEPRVDHDVVGRAEEGLADAEAVRRDAVIDEPARQPEPEPEPEPEPVADPEPVHDAHVDPEPAAVAAPAHVHEEPGAEYTTAADYAAAYH